MPDIVLSDVSKQWGDARAVRDLSFTARDGEFTVLLGPSGCGKSTSLRLIAGLDLPTSGTIHVGTQNVTDIAPNKRQLSMVFQSYALFPHLSVSENIVFGLKVRRVSASERQARLKKVTELVDLGPYLKRKPAELSGGQRQRVALARALIAENPILLMDEPLSNLDAKLRRDMRVEIRALQHRLGITVVYVTHDQVEAMSMADQVVLLNQGTVEQAGSPEDLYMSPVSVNVAQFVGTPPMNLIPLTRAAGGFVLPGCSEPIIASQGVDTDKAMLGVRPEDISVTGDHGHATATVLDTDYHGADTIVAADVAGTRILIRMSRKQRVGVGDRLALTWDDDASHLFDSATGKRL